MGFSGKKSDIPKSTPYLLGVSNKEGVVVRVAKNKLNGFKECWAETRNLCFLDQKPWGRGGRY